jgi:hypothetical protein
MAYPANNVSQPRKEPQTRSVDGRTAGHSIIIVAAATAAGLFGRKEGHIVTVSAAAAAGPEPRDDDDAAAARRRRNKCNCNKDFETATAALTSET